MIVTRKIGFFVICSIEDFSINKTGIKIKSPNQMLGFKSDRSGFSYMHTPIQV